MKLKDHLPEVLRFTAVGIIAVVVHYATYWMLQYWLDVNIAFTIGYFISFSANYLLSAKYTFRSFLSVKNGMGFSIAHALNYCLQLVLLNLFLWVGIVPTIAPLAVFSISVPVNFMLVRFVFHHL